MSKQAVIPNQSEVSAIKKAILQFGRVFKKVNDAAGGMTLGDLKKAIVHRYGRTNPSTVELLPVLAKFKDEIFIND